MKNHTQKTLEEFREWFWREYSGLLQEKLDNGVFGEMAKSNIIFNEVSKKFEQALQEAEKIGMEKVDKAIQESIGNDYYNIGIGSLDYHEKSAVDAFIETFRHRLSELKKEE